MTTTIDKVELAQRINSLEGLDNETKSQLLELLHERKRYGLVWEDKPEATEERLQNELPILREVKERAIISDDPAAPNHILIEGDNLEALTTLSYTHEGKIDVIYIDPPYNTGNKDFVYNDTYVDTEDQFRHSKWLSFMAKRLKIAKRLLSDKGVIFISIDDNEQAQLKLLCDEVFGIENFQSNFTRITTKRIKGDVHNVNIIHDYVLMYSKNPLFRVIHKQKEDYSIYEEEDEFVESRGKHLIRPLDNRNINYSSNSDYEIVAPDGSIIVAGSDMEEYKRRKSGAAGKKDWCFRWNKEKLQWGIQNGFIVFKKTKDNQWRCYFKIYQFVDNNLQPTQKFDSYTSFIDECYNNQGTTEIKSILGNTWFSYPKPLSLLQTLLPMVANNSLILDFFAGSGTTLHATMQLNAEDGGHRQCILVTNNENNICEEVTYERNKRVIKGYTTPKGEQVEGLHANTLRYFKTDFVVRESSATAKRELMYAATDMLCIKNNIYTEMREFCGMKFKPSILRYFRQDADNQMLIIYDERAVEYIVPLVHKLEGKLKIYVFSHGAYAYEDEFLEVRDKVELCALPEAILQAYKQVLPQNDEEVRI